MTISRLTTKRADGSKRVIETYSCGNWKNKGTAVCNSNAIRVEKANAYVMDKIAELVNDESILRKVVDNINKNKSTKLKPTLEQIEQLNKEIEKLNIKKNKNIELFEDGILTKSELSTRVKSINDDIEKLKLREQELKQEVDLAEGEPVPYQLVRDVMDRFKEVFLSMGTSQQRKQLIYLLISKITMNKEREIDSIEIQINNDVITYLKKDGLPNKQGNPSFLHLCGIDYINFKIVI